jgi:hypothetical protein
MSSMFEGASSFNQDLCQWSNLIKDEITYFDINIFKDSGCDDTTSPTTSTSNWCQVCQ